jgi:predicted aspartyl protease
MIIISTVLILAVVCILAFIINGIEDYHRKDSLVKLSFGETLGKLKLPIVTLMNNGTPFKFLIDTGATLSVIDSNVIDKLDCVKLVTQGTAYGIDGNTIDVSYIRMNLMHNNISLSEEFQVMRVPAFDSIKATDNIDISGILGSTFLKRYNSVINFKDLIVYFDLEDFNKNDLCSNFTNTTSK